MQKSVPSVVDLWCSCSNIFTMCIFLIALEKMKGFHLDLKRWEHVTYYLSVKGFGALNSSACTQFGIESSFESARICALLVDEQPGADES